MRATWFMMMTSEIRRKDRRGATPEHILYMFVKLMRYRVSQGLFATFRRGGDVSGISRRMLEDPSIVNQCFAQNLAFLKSIPM